jgi:glycerol-3-phosphate acyltransferase PlsY
MIIAVVIFSYLLGCFNTGYYYIRFFYKKDVRTVGTNVTGAYNVSKLGGKKGFIITFLGDALKGALPVIICRLLIVDDAVIMMCILMVIIGHIFPVQLKFKGGKGLSTAFGAFLALHPIIIVFWLVTSILFFPFVRRYTVTCLFALTFLPLELFIFDYPLLIVIYFILFIIVIIYACRGNFTDYIKERAYHGKTGDKKKNK